MPKKEVSKVEPGNRKKKETIIVCSAHSDDFVIGAGGTINEYRKQGKRVIAIVFSYGEMSLPWLKEKIAQRIRTKEAFKAGRFLRCRIIFYNLREGHFKEDYKKNALEKKLLTLLNRENPTKLFTHSSEDPHPDHRAVHKITLQLYEKLEEKPEVYTYSVWNPVSFKTSYPSLYVDVSKSFMTKLRTLKKFRSQKIHVAYPFFLLMYRAFTEGFKIRKRFAEKFFRIR